MKLVGLSSVALLLAMAPAPARAQGTTTEGTSQPTQGQVQGEPETGEAPTAATPPPHWIATIAARESWDTNPQFGATTGQGSWVTGVDGHVVYSGRFERGTLSAGGDGGLVRYSQAEGLNEFIYAGQLSGTWRATPRLNVAFDQSYSSTYTHQTAALLQEGLVLPQEVVHRLGSSVSAARRLTERTSLTAFVRYEHVSFPGDSQLVNGNEFTVGSGFTRQLSKNDSVSLGYSYLNDTVPSLNGGPTGSNSIHTLTAGWSRQIAQRWTSSVSGGVATFTPVGSATRTWEPQGAVNIERKTRRWTVGASYSRSVGQAFGLGRQRVADVAGGNFAFTMTRTLAADAVYTRSWNRDPADTQYSFDDDSVGADLRWTLFRRLGLMASYAFRRSTGGQATSASTALSGNVYALSVSYGKEWQ